MTYEEILNALNGLTVAVAEQKYNMDISAYEPVVLHYRLLLQKNINWNWLTQAHEATGQKSLRAVQVENPAVGFDSHCISHPNDFAYHFGLIDENHQISERSGDLSAIDFYKPQSPHINQKSLVSYEKPTGRLCLKEDSKGNWQPLFSKGFM